MWVPEEKEFQVHGGSAAQDCSVSWAGNAVKGGMLIKGMGNQDVGVGGLSRGELEMVSESRYSVYG